ncbi:MAG TPA: DUF2249 domain-containing protein [Gemmatimonadaceae bacterium]|nr:DUF2249 domain-containing protein [Gemmatimonadaceae bacterium]
MSTTSATQPVAAGDRVNDVLARDERLVEVFVHHSSHFTKLRNRTLRKVMGRLVTVDDAARIAAVPVDALVRDLNAALGIWATTPASPLVTERQDAGPSRTHPPDARVVEVDVRDDLRKGREPLARIMAAVSALRDDEVLRVRAIFHPVPLLTVLGKRGFANESEEHAPDDWSVWFWRDSPDDVSPESPRRHEVPVGASRTSEAPTVSSRTSEASVGTLPPSDDHTVWLDVRGLQPPEPLVRTLAALETLPDGHQLIQLNERVPQLLLPMLAERGFACELDDSLADRVLLRIWRPA